MKKNSSCRVCGKKTLLPFFDLGKQPLANYLLKSPKQEEKLYPLSLSFCRNCSLVQLNHTINPHELFSQYVWVTGTSKTANDFAKTFYKELVKRAGKNKNQFVLELASNDGTFLVPFIKNGFNVLGVDPAENIADIASKNGIPTECVFFGTKTGQLLIKQYGKANIIFARNVLPHVANTRDFVKGISLCLADKGIVAIEVHYAKIILEELQYDSIYHEHLCYFTIKTLGKLLNDFDLYIFDIAKSPISGGSVIVYANKNKERASKTLEEYKLREEKEKINDFKRWNEFAKKSLEHKELLATMIKKSAKNKTIVGYGSSARSSTLLNFCGINNKIISAIADQNTLKQGLYTPGTHIRIESPENVFSKKTSSVILLAWNFRDEIVELLRKKYRYKGEVIIPFPNKPLTINI